MAGISLVSLSAGAALAQETPEASDAGETTEVVVYAPIRSSAIAALREQRNADNLVSVIAADTVGRFPDQNSAAALSRLPAVAVQRDQGQERYIQVRGAPNRWTSVSFDGVPVIGVDEGGSGRAFRFDAVPAIILRSLAVNKSLTPEMPAEAIVAQIDLRTFSPFHRKGFDLQGDLGYGEMDLGGGDQRQGAVRGTWSNGTFGVVAAVSHYQREQITDNREFDYDSNDILSGFDARNYRLVRENNGAALGFEWRPADGHSLFAKVVYSEFKDDEERNHYTFQLGSGTGTRTASGGSLTGVPIRSTAQYGHYRTKNTIITLGGDHSFANAWNASWRLNNTQTENTSYLPLLYQMQSGNPSLYVSFDYDLSDPNYPIISNLRSASGNALETIDQGAFNVNMALPIYSLTETDSYTFKGDLWREFGNWTVKGGLQYDDREIEGNTMATSKRYALSSSGTPSLAAANYVTGENWHTGFPLGFTMKYIDNRRLRADLDTRLNALGVSPADGVTPETRYNIKETLAAGYAQGKYDFGFGQVVFGARVENMKQEISGFMVTSSGTTPLTVENDYTDFFPSANFKFNLSDRLVARASLQRGVARASFGDIRAGASIDDVEETIGGGNPHLKPEYTNGLDGSLEFYISGDSVISVSGFYRDVSNVLYSSTTRVTDTTYNADGVDRRGYEFNTTLNGQDGQLYGLEFDYQQRFAFLPSPWDGLGVTGNVAFLDGSFNTYERADAPFPGTSKTIVNTSVYYEKYGLSARLSYQWRDDWLDTLGSLGLGTSEGDSYRKAYGNLDLSLRYALNNNLTLYFDGSNLTDEEYIAFVGNERHPTEVEQIGSRYMAGIRFNF